MVAAMRLDFTSQRPPSDNLNRLNAAVTGLGQLPLSFEPNQGQTDPQVRFLAHGSRYALFLTPQEAVLKLQAASATSPKTAVLRMQIENANSSGQIAGTRLLTGVSNYLRGNDPAKWQRNVPHFAEVRYRNILPGTDVIYYGRQGQLEYDFEVAPGASVNVLKLAFGGVSHLGLNPAGDLNLSLDGGSITLQAPHVYQTIGGERKLISGRFVLQADNKVGFAVGDYDHNRTLVIDPLLSYSTYLGGTGEESCSTIIGAPVTGSTSQGANAGTPGCPAIAVDASQSVYLAGSSTSTDFPNPVASPALRGTADVFIAKLSPSASTQATQLIYSTFLSGTSGISYTAGLAVDSAFQATVAGTTNAPDFPAAQGYQSAPKTAGNHVFATKLDVTGSSPVYSTYLSGSGVDLASGLAVDTSGQIYVTGTTTSADFPVTTASFQTVAKASSQFFFSKINPAVTGPSSLLYSSYIGGSATTLGGAPINIGGGIAVDGSFNVYISGGTNFIDMPVLNAYQEYSAGLDAWVARFTFPQNSQTPPSLGYLSYFGGAGDDIAYGVAVDSAGDAYIAGSTTSSDIALATSTTPFQASIACTTITDNVCPTPDAFVAKFGVICTATSCTTTTLPFIYFSYLGGTGSDVALGLVVDSISGAKLTGWTNSTDFHTQNNPSNLNYGGGVDAFVSRIDTTSVSSTSPSNFSTYLGGTGTDVGTGIAIDALDQTYASGETASTNFPVANSGSVIPPFQTILQGGSDAYATKLGASVSLTVTETATPNPVGVGNNVTFTYTVTNTGDAVTGLNFNSPLPASGATFVSATASPGSCGSVTNGSVGCTLGTLDGGGIATVNIILTPTIAGPLGNTGTVSVAGSSLTFSPNAPSSTTANDFTLTASPEVNTIPAGLPAAYNLVVTPTGNIPNSVSLACGSGLPTGASCAFPQNANPIPNLNLGAAQVTLLINSTQRVTTTVELWRGRSIYAALLPMFGMAFLGIGLGRRSRRRLLSGVLLVICVSLVGVIAGCHTSSSTTTTTGTPAGTYIITINATTGSITRSTAVTYVVQ